MASDRWTARTITDEAALRAIIGTPLPLIVSKILDRLNPRTRPFIERSPFVCVATTDAEGRCDVSPRGDPPGFVRILDDQTLFVPERPGNRIADTLRNVLATGRIGLLFVIPGITDTFRVNGRAILTDDPELCAPSEVEGKVPKLGILVAIEEAFTQCSKALLRSHLWDPTRHIDRAALPTNGEIFREIVGGEFDAEAYDVERNERYARREGFY
jgi:PPOX class probable FMN-dependent enzyme